MINVSNPPIKKEFFIEDDGSFYGCGKSFDKISKTVAKIKQKC